MATKRKVTRASKTAPARRPRDTRHKLKEGPISKYGPWDINPQVIRPTLPALVEPVPRNLEIRAMDTMYEGSVAYLRFWNFWVRVGTPADPPHDYFFYDYESAAPGFLGLLAAIGVPTALPRSEEEVWARISGVWDWLGASVRVNHAAYIALAPGVDRWPSIVELAGYYRDHRELVWSACFSKAHLFASLLGRVLPRWHTTIVSAHHTEGGAPPSASHVYVGIYLTGRWYYLDPTAVYGGPLPTFSARRSVGLFATVDYEHPFSALPVPLSPLDQVPHLPA